MEWSKKYNGITHLGKLSDTRRATVIEHKDCCILQKWTRDCGFTPEEIILPNIDIAKEQGESWVNGDKFVYEIKSPTIHANNDGPIIIDKNILAVIQHFHTKIKQYIVLKIVDDDDCNFRTVDDNSELSHDWDVIAWDYLPKLEN